MYRDFWVPYAAEMNASSPSETVTLHGLEANWLFIMGLQVFFQIYMICVCVLLDKKHHRVLTGRKFFTAELSSARPKSE